MSNYHDFSDDIAAYHLQKSTLTPYKNLKKWQARWKEDLIMHKCSEKTIKGYIHATNILLFFAKKHRKIDLTMIGAKYINRCILDYQITLAEDKYKHAKVSAEELTRLKKERKKKNIGKNDANFTIYEIFENTLSHRVTIIKMFLRFITENNKELHDYTRIFKSIVNVKIQDKFTDHLTKQELFSVLELMHVWVDVFKQYKPKSSIYSAYRDALCLIIYALTGARSSEVVYIKLKDIVEHVQGDEVYYIIKIENGKGGKKRSVAIKKPHIEKFINYMRSNLPSEEYYLSSTYKKGYTNKPLSPDTIRVFSNFILRHLNINKTGLHAYRRAYVTKRIGEDKVDVSIVAKEVGNTVAILEKHYLKHSAEAFL